MITLIAEIPTIFFKFVWIYFRIIYFFEFDENFIIYITINLRSIQLKNCTKYLYIYTYIICTHIYVYLYMFAYIISFSYIMIHNFILFYNCMILLIIIFFLQFFMWRSEYGISSLGFGPISMVLVSDNISSLFPFHIHDSRCKKKR